VWTLAFGVVTVVFIYALVANEIQRPDGLLISSFFIAAMIFTSRLAGVPLARPQAGAYRTRRDGPTAHRSGQP
jgi:hypothetical protein